MLSQKYQISLNILSPNKSNDSINIGDSNDSSEICSEIFAVRPMEAYFISDSSSVNFYSLSVDSSVKLFSLSAASSVKGYSN